MKMLAFLIVAASMLALASCEFLQHAAHAIVGGSPSGAATAAARKVDEALGGWFWSLFFSSDTAKVVSGAAITEGARLCHRTHRKRKARKAADREAKERADAIIGAARS